MLSHRVRVSEYFCPKRGWDFQLSRRNISQEPSEGGLLCCAWLPCAFPIVVAFFNEVDNGIQFLVFNFVTLGLYSDHDVSSNTSLMLLLLTVKMIRSKGRTVFVAFIFLFVVIVLCTF